MPKTPIRALTIGVAEPHPLPARVVEDMAGKLHQSRHGFEQAGYEVQTVRLSTCPLLSDLAGWAPKDIGGYGAELQGALDGAGVAFCSLGPAPRDASAEQVNALADLVAKHEGLNGSVMVATADDGLDVRAARAAGEVMLRLAAETEEGFGNFGFAALACVGPGGPFFPAAYHAGPANLGVGLQGAGIVAEALRGGAELAEVTDRAATRCCATAALLSSSPKNIVLRWVWSSPVSTFLPHPTSTTALWPRWNWRAMGCWATRAPLRSWPP